MSTAERADSHRLSDHGWLEAAARLKYFFLFLLAILLLLVSASHYVYGAHGVTLRTQRMRSSRGSLRPASHLGSVGNNSLAYLPAPVHGLVHKRAPVSFKNFRDSYSQERAVKFAAWLVKSGYRDIRFPQEILEEAARRNTTAGKLARLASGLDVDKILNLDDLRALRW